MRQPKSVYYPPRARWYGRFAYLGTTLLRRLPLHWLQLPRGLSAQQVLISLVLPGFIFFALRWKRAGQLVLGAYGACLLATLVWLGSALASFTFGFMVALHGMSWAGLVETWLEPGNWQRRLLLALAATLVAASLLYLPVQRFVQNRLVMPLRIGGRTLLVIPDSGRLLEPGSSAIFRVDAGGAPGLRVEAGFVITEILGKAGDHVLFQSGSYRVGGVSRPALPQMPVVGEWVVPENHWFIWPFSGIGIQGNLGAVNPASASAVIQDLAFVPTSHAVGRPLRWWFWRRLYVP
jgi:hypothetical protein